MNSVRTFRWIDFLTLALPGIAVAIITILMAVFTQSGTVSVAAYALMSTVSVAFLFIYGFFVYERHKFIARVDFVTKQDLAVITNGFKIKQSDVEQLTELTISSWQSVTGWTGVKSAIDKGHDDLLWVEFKSGTVECDQVVGKLAGYTIGRSIVVGFAERPNLDDTAFRHELGHVIFSAWKNNYDQSAEHAYIREHGLK